MKLFLLFPFSRLLLVLSGFAVVTYLTRSYQIVRQRG
jgi:nitrate reductase gamma subunit